MEEQYLTISALNKYIKAKLESDQHLTKVYLKGEVSNFVKHSRGHLYFSLKDENSKINAVMFKSNADKLPFDVANGMKVLVIGSISVYEPYGNYQIIVSSLTEDGLGNLYVKFEQLKKKLELNGLFDITNKKPIPRFPKRIGIITAPTGAAIRDIHSTINRRYPLCETFLFPALVQGKSASASIVNCLKHTEHYELDVIILGRGGGSIEDLWPFNEEEVAYAIHNCSTPIISAVGHEVDFTISDFVSDLRAPTPTGAAEMAVPDKSEIISYLDNQQKRLYSSIKSQFTQTKKHVYQLSESSVFRNPERIYMDKSQKLDHLITRIEKDVFSIYSKYNNKYLNIDIRLNNLNPVEFYKLKRKEIEKLEVSLLNSINNIYRDHEYAYANLVDKLEILSPLNALKRGYTLMYDSNGYPIKSVHDVNIGDTVNSKVSDGSIFLYVKGKKENS